MNNENEKVVEKGSKVNWNVIIAAAIMVIVIGICVVLLLFSNSKNIYNNVYQNSYDEAFKKSFEESKQKYKVTNTVNITVENLQTNYNELEVLEIHSIDYTTSNSSENKEKIDSVYSVEMSGIYCVNMALAEYIIEGDTVLIRLPEPYLAHFKTISEDVLYFEKNQGKFISLNGNYREGENFSREQLTKCKEKTKKNMSNQNDFLQAKESAEFIITNLVKNLNPDVPDIKVKFEYVELEGSNNE